MELASILYMWNINHEATVTALFRLNHETLRTAFMTREVIARTLSPIPFIQLALPRPGFELSPLTICDYQDNSPVCMPLHSATLSVDVFSHLSEWFVGWTNSPSTTVFLLVGIIDTLPQSLRFAVTDNFYMRWIQPESWKPSVESRGWDETALSL